MRIYVASSWRNEIYPSVLAALRQDGHACYDFRNENSAFSWERLDPNWRAWSPAQTCGYLQNNHDSVERAFANDAQALERCEALVLVLPCGRSAHLEAGFAAALGKPTVALIAETGAPDLMHKMLGYLTHDLEDVRDWLRGQELRRGTMFR